MSLSITIVLQFRAYVILNLEHQENKTLHNTSFSFGKCVPFCKGLLALRRFAVMGRIKDAVSYQLTYRKLSVEKQIQLEFH